MTTYISINGQTIRTNTRRGTNNPPIRIATTPSDSKPVYASRVKIHGPVELVYDPQNRIMRCGARLVLKTDAMVEIIE